MYTMYRQKRDCKFNDYHPCWMIDPNKCWDKGCKLGKKKIPEKCTRIILKGVQEYSLILKSEMATKP